MVVHQQVKGEPNWSKYGTIIGTNVCIHRPSTQTLIFLPFRYLAIYISEHVFHTLTQISATERLFTAAYPMFFL